MTDIAISWFSCCWRAMKSMSTYQQLLDRDFASSASDLLSKTHYWYVLIPSSGWGPTIKVSPKTRTINTQILRSVLLILLYICRNSVACGSARHSRRCIMISRRSSLNSCLPNHQMKAPPAGWGFYSNSSSSTREAAAGRPATVSFLLLFCYRFCLGFPLSSSAHL